MALLKLKRPGIKWPELISKEGFNTDFGGLMNKNNQLSETYSAIIDGFRSFHDRRNKTLSSHPYDKKTKKQTYIITSKEQNKLQEILQGSYDVFIKELTNLL